MQMMFFMVKIKKIVLVLVNGKKNHSLVMITKKSPNLFKYLY